MLQPPLPITIAMFFMVSSSSCVSKKARCRRSILRVPLPSSFTSPFFSLFSLSQSPSSYNSVTLGLGLGLASTLVNVTFGMFGTVQNSKEPLFCEGGMNKFRLLTCVTGRCFPNSAGDALYAHLPIISTM